MNYPKRKVLLMDCVPAADRWRDETDYMDRLFGFALYPVGAPNGGLEQTENMMERALLMSGALPSELK